MSQMQHCGNVVSYMTLLTSEFMRAIIATPRSRDTVARQELELAYKWNFNRLTKYCFITSGFKLVARNNLWAIYMCTYTSITAGATILPAPTIRHYANSPN